MAAARALEIQLSDDTDKRSDQARQAATQAALFMCLATIFHKRLENAGLPHLKLESVASLRSDPRGADALEKSWNAILGKDFAPVFEPALGVLHAMRRAGNDSQGLCRAIQTLCEKADEHADEYAACGEDRAGALFQKALQNPSATGSFYTKPESATLLAELTCDAMADKGSAYWKDPEAWHNRRIVDPACGSGTLLTAMKAAILRRVDPEMKAEIDRILIEDSIVGLDINWQALQLAATQLTIGSLSADFQRIGLYRMPYGHASRKNIFVEGDPGDVGLGSLEILALLNKRAMAPDLPGLVDDSSSRPRQTGVVGESDIERIATLVNDAEVMIANPPYTVGSKAGRDQEAEIRHAAQARWKSLKNSLKNKTKLKSEVVETDSVSPRFTLLMEHFSNRESGVLAKVLPTTALLGVGGDHEREFLLDKYDVLYVVTVHNPCDISWSVDAGIQESLLLLKRKTGKAVPASFINLNKLPNSSRKSISLAETILKRELKKSGSIRQVTQECIRARGWCEVLYLSNILSQKVYSLEKFLSNHERICKLESMYQLYSTNEYVTKSKWEWCEKDEREVQVVRSASTSIQKTIFGKIDAWSKRSKAGMSNPTELDRLRDKAGHLLISCSQNSQTGRLTSVALETKAVGSLWTPIQCDLISATRLSVWFNSVVGRILLRNRLSRAVTWPAFKPEAIKNLYIPSRLTPEGESALDDAWERTKNREVGIYREGAGEVHRIWDRAVSVVLGMDYVELEQMRDLLDQEPTVCGKLPESSD